MERFRNVIAIVTGGGGGIGAAICERLASEGAHVVVCDVDKGLGETLATGLRDRGLRAETRTVDITSREACTQLVDDVVATHGRIDVLVNNAGIFPRAAFLELDEAQWDAVLDTNLKGTFVCSQEAARRMVEAGRPGVIINLVSGAPYRGGLRATAYMASKLGIVGLTRGMARELAPHRIRVNAVAPGVTNTAMPRLGNTEEALAVLARTNPTGRLAEPEDIADVIVFLATDDARHLIGQVVHVNGGDYHG